MSLSFQSQSPVAKTRPLYADKTPKIPATDRNPAWRPQPCPLSREELRRIIAEQLG
jgi:hypothetical protein